MAVFGGGKGAKQKYHEERVAQGAYLTDGGLTYTYPDGNVEDNQYGAELQQTFGGPIKTAGPSPRTLQTGKYAPPPPPPPPPPPAADTSTPPPPPPEPPAPPSEPKPPPPPTRDEAARQVEKTVEKALSEPKKLKNARGFLSTVRTSQKGLLKEPDSVTRTLSRVR